MTAAQPNRRDLNVGGQFDLQKRQVLFHQRGDLAKSTLTISTDQHDPAGAIANDMLGGQRIATRIDDRGRADVESRSSRIAWIRHRQIELRHASNRVLSCNDGRGPTQGKVLIRSSLTLWLV